MALGEERFEEVQGADCANLSRGASPHASAKGSRDGKEIVETETEDWTVQSSEKEPRGDILPQQHVVQSNTKCLKKCKDFFVPAILMLQIFS